MKKIIFVGYYIHCYEGYVVIFEEKKLKGHELFSNVLIFVNELVGVGKCGKAYIKYWIKKYEV